MVGLMIRIVGVSEGTDLQGLLHEKRAGHEDPCPIIAYVLAHSAEETHSRITR